MRITEKEIGKFKEIGWQFFWYHPGDDCRYITRARNGENLVPMVDFEQKRHEILAFVEWSV